MNYAIDIILGLFCIVMIGVISGGKNPKPRELKETAVYISAFSFL